MRRSPDVRLRVTVILPDESSRGGVWDYTNRLLEHVCADDSTSVSEARVIEIDDVEFGNVVPASTDSAVRSNEPVRDLLVLQYTSFGWGVRPLFLIWLLFMITLERVECHVIFHEAFYPIRGQPLRRKCQRSLLRMQEAVLSIIADRILTADSEIATVVRSIPVARHTDMRRVPVPSNIPFKQESNEDLQRLRRQLLASAGSRSWEDGTDGWCLALLWSRRLEAGKGHRRVFKGFSGVGPESERSLLVCLGPMGTTGGETHSECVAMIEDAGVGEYVRWLGYQEEEVVSAILQTCDCLLLPYQTTRIQRSGVFAAALQHGLPLVVRGGVDLPEAVSMGVVSAGEFRAEELATALQEVRRLDRGIVAEQLQRAYWDEYSWDHVVDAILP